MLLKILKYTNYDNSNKLHSALDYRIKGLFLNAVTIVHPFLPKPFGGS